MRGREDGREDGGRPPSLKKAHLDAIRTGSLAVTFDLSTLT